MLNICSFIKKHFLIKFSFLTGVAQIMKSPGSKTTGAGAMYGMAASIPDRSIVGDLTKAYLDAFYDSTNWFFKI